MIIVHMVFKGQGRNVENEQIEVFINPQIKCAHNKYRDQDITIRVFNKKDPSSEQPLQITKFCNIFEIKLRTKTTFFSQFSGSHCIS